MEPKKYRFDYVREQVMNWDPTIRQECTLDMIENCAHISMPWIMPGEYIPAHDYYGQEVDSVGDWYSQKHEYCKKLYDELYAERPWYIKVKLWWNDLLLFTDVLLLQDMYDICINIRSWFINKCRFR